MYRTVVAIAAGLLLLGCSTSESSPEKQADSSADKAEAKCRTAIQLDNDGLGFGDFRDVRVVPFGTDAWKVSGNIPRGHFVCDAKVDPEATGGIAATYVLTP